MRRKVDLLILLLVLIIGLVAVLNAQAIGDWWHARQYQPPSEVAKLADDAGMNDKGKRLFYRYSPEIADQSTINSHCSGDDKLGCTEGQHIYILQASDASDYNRNIVTAAHEMLHVAYSRLSADQKDDLEPLLKTELLKADSASINKLLDNYSDADYYNEAHSYVGSQSPSISSELSTYYSKYFSDRGKSTRAYDDSPQYYN
jgi:hypothetical protein